MTITPNAPNSNILFPQVGGAETASSPTRNAITALISSAASARPVEAGDARQQLDAMFGEPAFTDALVGGGIDAAALPREVGVHARAGVTALLGAPVRLARADVVGPNVVLTPDEVNGDGENVPQITIPNTVEAEGFHRAWHAPTVHDYVFVFKAPAALRGREGLEAIGAALRADPTPGDDEPASPEGTRNDVGNLPGFDGGDNYVKSFHVAPDRIATNISSVVVNYTIPDEHMLHEGFVIRYAVMADDGSIFLVNYGEGNDFTQNELFEDIFVGGEAEKVWQENSEDVFDAAIESLK